MFDSPAKLALGLVTGIVFGFLLQKGHAAKHSVIVGQLRFRDFTVVKVMGTAIAVGAVGFYLLVGADVTAVDVKPAQLGGILVGGVLFGSGMAVLGYCPGTTVAAVGEGNRDAAAGLVGMLVGALAFVVGFPAADAVRNALPDLGKTTWPQLTSSSPWIWIAALVAAVIVMYLAQTRRRGKRTGVDASRTASNLQTTRYA